MEKLRKLLADFMIEVCGFSGVLILVLSGVVWLEWVQARWAVQLMREVVMTARDITLVAAFIAITLLFFEPDEAPKSSKTP